MISFESVKRQPLEMNSPQIHGGHILLDFLHLGNSVGVQLEEVGA